MVSGPIIGRNLILTCNFSHWTQTIDFKHFQAYFLSIIKFSSVYTVICLLALSKMIGLLHNVLNTTRHMSNKLVQYQVISTFIIQNLHDSSCEHGWYPWSRDADVLAESYVHNRMEKRWKGSNRKFRQKCTIHQWDTQNRSRELQLRTVNYFVYLYIYTRCLRYECRYFKY